MRAFIGVALPPTVQEALALLQHELAASRADVKWVEPSNLHLTLKFLDEITEPQRQEVEAMLRRVAGTVEPFTLALQGVGAFPSLGAPRVIWVGILEGKDVIARIARAIEEESRALKLRREEHTFACHLTLGRVRSSRGREALAHQLRALQWSPPAQWTVDSVTLYQSVLSSAGPRYTVLAEVPLRPMIGDR
jgi:2'-5' RNA ligase